MTETSPKTTQIDQVDFRIDVNGTWFHEGKEIKREALAKLFSDRALKIDGEGRYWLQTPYEKYAVNVEDVPYVAIDFEYTDQSIIFRTNMQEEIKLTATIQWEIRNGIPYFEVRNGLFAKIGRSVLYNLIEQFGESLKVNATIFPLGDLHE
ncbi:MAG: DUF1285 domain-containing protein [Bdellovibrionales bacterium]